MLINQEPDLMVGGEAEDAQKAMEMIDAVTPDMVIVDISLPGVDGIELLKNMKHRLRELPALVVSMHDEGLFAERVLRAGARGYIMKQEAVDKVLIGIRRVLAGEIFVSNSVTTKMVEKLVDGWARPAPRPWIFSAIGNSPSFGSSARGSEHGRSPTSSTSASRQ